MAEKSGFFDAHIVGEEYDRVYLAEDFAKYFSSFITNGIFGGKSNELMVRQASPANMTVSVSSGHAWINGYKYENTNDLSLAIDIADGVLNRIDAIVLRWGKAERKIWATVKKGTPAANPVAPTLQRDSEYYELKLSEVLVVAGTINIVQSSIIDTRLLTDVCGYVVGAVQQFDTTYFGAQLNAYVNEYAAEYKKWLDEMEISGTNELSEVLERLNTLVNNDTVGLLINEIEGTKDKVLDIENGKPVENNYLANDKIVDIDIYEGAQLSMTSLIDFVQQGAGTASPNNVRHIVGCKTLNLSRYGKNMWTTDAVYPLGNPAGGKLLYDAATQKYTIKANAASYTGNIYKLPVPIPAGVKVTATMFLEKGKLDVGTIVFGGFNDASEQWQCDVRVPEGGVLAGRIVTKTLTTTLPITHFRAFIYSDNVVTEDIILRMQFEFGDAATAFELYRGSVFTTNFDNTIYGGEYNWETGKLTVSKTCVTLTGTENVELSEGKYGGHNLFVIRNSTNNVNTLKAAVSSHGRQSNTAFELYSDVGDFALWVSPERLGSWFGILSDATTVNEFKNYLAEQYANGTPYTMVYENYVPVIAQHAGQNIFAIQGRNYISSNAGNTKVSYNHVSKTYVEANFVNKTANGVVQSENADYAEVAEWSDGNPNGEDRIGYFVCVDVDAPGINIKKAGTFDNVRGVTMKSPAFSANCTPDKFDENGNLLPQFNYVGFAGFIPVIDNGTCTVGSYCMPGEDGTAIPSVDVCGYQVIERIDDSHVLILVEPGADAHVRMKIEAIGHTENKFNPHNVTAEQVGALPSDGGTVSGSIFTKHPTGGETMVGAVYTDGNYLSLYANNSSGTRGMWDSKSQRTIISVTDTGATFSGMGFKKVYVSFNSSGNGSTTATGATTASTVLATRGDSGGVVGAYNCIGAADCTYANTVNFAQNNAAATSWVISVWWSK